MPFVNVDKDTVMCISLAARPGNFGTRVHNAAFQALELNFIYKAFGITDIAGAIAGVRALGIRGCGISMPFKENVMRHLDKIDKVAAGIGAVNTIVNEDGILTGYNTDAYGAQKALEGIEGLASKKVLLIGAGGAAKAILHALRELGAEDVIITNRSPERAKIIAAKWGYHSAPWDERSQIDAEVLINATPIGMYPDVEQCPVEEQAIARSSAVMDVITNPIESLLIQIAKRMGRMVIPGCKMSLFQAAMQFKLYTGVEPPLDVMEGSIADLLGRSKIEKTLP